MKLFESLVGVILENQSKINKYYKGLVKPKEGKTEGVIDLNTLINIVRIDPTTRVPEDFDIENVTEENLGEIVTGKYTEWLLKMYISPKDFCDSVSLGDYRDSFLEDVESIKMLLVKHSRYKDRIINPDERNIQNVKSLCELPLIKLRTGKDEETTLIMYTGEKALTLADGEQLPPSERFKHHGSEIVKIGSEYTLIRITKKDAVGGEAASHFGGYHEPSKGESNWCTSPKNSHNFYTYINRGPIYIIMANDDKGSIGQITKLPQERYQFTFSPDSFEFKDRLNKNVHINLDDLAAQISPGGRFGEFYDIFKEELKIEVKNITKTSDIVKNQKELVLDFNRFSNRHEQFMYLYVKAFGSDELFSSINPSITMLKLNNFPLPKNPKLIEKFASTLVTLHIKNSPTEIPNIFKNFDKLTVVNLEDNPNFKKVPSSLLDLPNLIFFAPPSGAAEIKELINRGFVRQGTKYLKPLKPLK
jgi:hypothetical protein